MLIASFDVGVKNLAFCVMSYDPKSTSGSQYPIECWNCLDLTEKENSTDGLCTSKTASGKECGKLGKVITDEGKWYCGVHNPDKEKYKLVKKQGKKVAALSYDAIGNALMDKLETYKDIWDKCDHIIIEQQFTKNRRMIFLSAILFSYFLQTGQRNPNSKISKIKFASSRNKLLVYDGPEITERTRKGEKDHRKWLAIKHCEWLIRNDQVHQSYLLKYPKKKDDLSDCFLQGADYLKNDCRATARRKEASIAAKARKKIKVTKKSSA